MTNYPNGIDNDITLPGVSGSTPEDIAINALRSAVFAIETELGILPSGVYPSVRTRSDILEARINALPVPSPSFGNPYIFSSTGISISSGVGYPTENRVDGSLY